jgi:hypothetical protein
MELTPEQQAIIADAEHKAQRLILNLGRFERLQQRKYDYYNADNDSRDYGISVPNKMRWLRPGIGWASRAVNILSDRVVFDGFANDTFGVNASFGQINALPVINKAKHDAIITGCAFVAVGDRDADGDIDGDGPVSGTKILVPFTSQEATGWVDEYTGLLKAGLAVTRWENWPTTMANGEKRIMTFWPRDYTIFTRQYTANFVDGEIVEVIPNPTGRCLLMPIIRRPTAQLPLGQGRVNNTVRRIIDEVARLKRREEVAEEFYALPQRYITGLAEGAKKDPNLDSAIGKVWAITQDEDGNKPDVGQLQQMSIEGFVGAKKDKARDFCAETGLTLRNLGYETGNPTSSDSLEAMSDDLVLEAQACQGEMGEQIRQIAITLYMAQQGINTVPDALMQMVPAWKPIFKVNIGQAGDAMFKLFQAMPELVGTTEGYQMLGISLRQAEQLQKLREQNKSSGFMVGAGGQGGGTQ